MGCMTFHWALTPPQTFTTHTSFATSEVRPFTPVVSGSSEQETHSWNAYRYHSLLCCGSKKQHNGVCCCSGKYKRGARIQAANYLLKPINCISSVKLCFLRSDGFLQSSLSAGNESQGSVLMECFRRARKNIPFFFSQQCRLFPIPNRLHLIIWLMDDSCVSHIFSFIWLPPSWIHQLQAPFINNVKMALCSEDSASP